MATDDYFSRKAAANHLCKLGCPVSPAMLANMASNGNSGKGPPFYRYRRFTVRYTREDLEAWAAKQIQRVE